MLRLGLKPQRYRRYVRISHYQRHLSVLRDLREWEIPARPSLEVRLGHAETLLTGIKRYVTQAGALEHNSH